MGKINNTDNPLDAVGLRLQDKRSTGHIILKDKDIKFYVDRKEIFSRDKIYSRVNEVENRISSDRFVVFIASNEAGDNVKNAASYICNGITDATIINEAIQNLPDTGGTIRLSGGVFYISESIIIDRPVQLIGDGQGLAGRANPNLYGQTTGITTIRASADVDVIRVYNESAKVRGIRFSDFLLQGYGKDVSTKCGIKITTQTDIMSMFNISVADCYIGLFGKNFDAPNVLSCGFQWNKLGVLLVDNDFVSLNQCVIADNTGATTVTVDGTTYTVNTGGVADASWNTSITQCIFARNDSDVLAGTNNVLNAISVLDSAYCKIDGNKIFMQNGNAIGIIGTASDYAEITQISNNTIVKFGTTKTAGKRCGVYIQKGHINHVFGNYIGSDLGGDTGEFAVYEDRSLTTYTGETTVKNNIFYYLVDADTKVELSGTGSAATDNVIIDPT